LYPPLENSTTRTTILKRQKAVIVFDSHNQAKTFSNSHLDSSIALILWVMYLLKLQFSKVPRADLTCDVIRKVAPFVLSKVWILVAHWSMRWSRDMFLIKLQLYQNWPCSRTTKRPVCQKYFNCTSNQATKHQNTCFKKLLVPLWRLYQHSFGLCTCPCDLQKVVAQCAPNLW